MVPQPFTGHGHDAHGAHGHHAPDEKTLTASYMLIGGVTLVMAMFYLVQHPEPSLAKSNDMMTR